MSLNRGGDPTNIIREPIPTGPIQTKYKPYFKVRRPGTKIRPSIIVIHSTANPTSTARQERNWLVNASNDRSASWNVAVDQIEAVEAIPCGEVSYSVLGTYPNHNAISIEICESGDRQATLENATELVNLLMGQWNIPIENVKKHRDFQIKTCPQILPDDKWDKFIDSIKALQNGGLNMAIYRINAELVKKKLAPLDQAYWLANAAFGKTCNGEWVKALILRVSKCMASPP
jgi:N-acetylmuramoyl-L-alanine amidase